jgi:amino acid adenylation domain-containing protein/non-ribosomal peptide synthase protein (TIGR01720 family)
VELVSLPLDHPRPPVPSYLRDTAELQLSASVAEGIDQFASRLNVSALTVLLAAVQTVLSRYTAQDTLVVGAAAQSKHLLSGQRAKLPLLPIRTSGSFRKDISAQTLIHEIAQEMAEVERDAEYPLRELQSWAGVRDAAFGFRLFNVAVCLADSVSDSASEWPTCDSDLTEYLVQCDVSIVAKPSPPGMVLKADFDTDVFERPTVERLLGHLGMMLDGMTAKPSAPVLSLPILTPQERRTLLVEWNSSQAWVGPYASLHQWFEAQVERTPNQVALTYETQSLTYGELNRRANRLAHLLREKGVGPGVIVALCLDRSLELVISLLGILKAGGAYLPIDPAYPKDRLAFMLEDAQAPFLVTQSKLAKELPLHQAHTICIDDPELSAFAAYPTSNPVNHATADTLAYVIYTSGTTGKSKGALITHGNVTRLFTATDPWYGFKATDVWTLFHSTAFDFSVWEIWGALLYGGRVVVVPFLVSRTPESFYELLVREGVTVLNQTPLAFRQLIQAEGVIGQKQLALRYVIFGGEALELQSLKPWFDRHGDQGPRLVNMYGITETTVHVTYRPLSKADLDSGSVIGVPIPDLQVYILDEQRQPVPVGIPGELYVGGAGLAKGYLRRPELTAERFIPDHLTGKEGGRLYRTGDLARFLPGRDIEYLGRIDHQVKIRGFRIELGEIESVLCQHPAVREAIVIAREDVRGVKTLAAYLITSSPVPQISALREHLKRKVPEYMVPAAFVFLDMFPLTTNGKIDRKALPAPEHHRPELADRYVAPRSPVEERLTEIWSRVLRVERIGVHDNFFELGGDSILSIQSVAAARRAGLMLTAKEMFTYQTIAELAAVIDGKTDVRLSQDMPEGSVPLTPIQRWFFEQNLDDPHHYNQALLLAVGERLERSLLERALMELSRQHDALRLRYVHDETGWRQYYSTADEPPPLDWVDTVQFDNTTRSHMIESMSVSTHRMLDLEQGPLWRVLYHDAGPDRLGRLLIVVHHLAVDGVSWRPLLEDLETIYLQLKSGQTVQLPSKTASFRAWSEELQDFAASDALRAELSYWKTVVSESEVPAVGKPEQPIDPVLGNTEGEAATVMAVLEVNETHALFHAVPPVYNTQINDVLLTALAQAWRRETGSSVLFANVEGHGREPLLKELDLSRTVGWFTSIFPLRLELPPTSTEWDPGAALKSVKEQLRKVPRHGIGYGLLRYLVNDAGLAELPEPCVVFNYFGQFDQVLSGSRLFRFAEESSGPWRSPKQRRRHALEINSMVKDGRLELAWTYCPALHSADSIERLAAEFLTALEDLIAHCQQPDAGGRTPSDFQLANLDQLSVDRLVAGRKDIDDIYRLSPIQSLFFAVTPGTQLSEFDQWQCTLRGTLNVVAFRKAWHETLHRHTILRSTIHGEGLNEPVQMVHRNVPLPWTIEDWRGMSVKDQAARWSEFLAKDREHPLMLTEPPVMRFALFQLADDSWRFVWSVPALLLDGWSWPIVFRDASKLYMSFCDDRGIVLDSVRPYRDYLGWLNKQSSKEAHVYWQSRLKGFRTPTLLPSEVPDGSGEGNRYLEYAVTFPPQLTADLHGVARRLQVTLSTMVQAAWALLLMRQSGADDVVFGTAFAGRPVELQGAESIVGPFVNNIPIRLHAETDWFLEELLKQLHSRILEAGPYQFMPLLDIHECSEVPWQYRLFDSLVVFQNYLVDEAARRFGRDVEIEDFRGPIHTNYPVLLLAEPGTTLKLALFYDCQCIARPAVERWGHDLAFLMEAIPGSLDRAISELRDKLSEPPRGGMRSRTRIHAASQNVVPPQTDLEISIALVWQKIFGLEQVSVEDNLFDLGGHSLLLATMHNRLRMALRRDFPLVTLFTHPTIRSLARHFGQGDDAVSVGGEQWRNRVQQQKAAMMHMRSKWGKKVS